MDSEFVRVSMPSRSDSCGSLPASRILNSSFWVLNVPAASTRLLAVKVRFWRRTLRPVRTVVTSQTPSLRCSKLVTVVSGCTSAPAFSAR
jgi:hypothetical protein